MPLGVEHRAVVLRRAFEEARLGTKYRPYPEGARTKSEEFRQRALKSGRSRKEKNSAQLRKPFAQRGALSRATSPHV